MTQGERKSEREGTVEAVLKAEDPSTFVTRRLPQIKVELAGIPGDRHYGLLRPADSRQKIYKRGTLIANRRQISVVSAEECAIIAERLGMDKVLPEWLGANLLVSGIEGLTQLPPGARLLFEGGVGLISEGENEPCIGPGKAIESLGEVPGAARRFVPAAKKLRGIVCSVEREGIIRSGESFRVIRI